MAAAAAAGQQDPRCSVQLRSRSHCVRGRPAGAAAHGRDAPVDELTGEAGQRLDASDPDQRNEAVRATIEASVELLALADRERLAELGVFAEDESVPVPLIAALWHATGGLDLTSSRTLCARLADLALLTPAPLAGTVTMHDVVRDYLREKIGTAHLMRLHRMLLDTMAKKLPAVGGVSMMTAWWELPGEERYLREHLIEHMLAAGRDSQAEETATELRWVDSRLRASGPAGPSADLALIGTPRAERPRRVLAQSAHLLGPTDPPHSLTNILYSRVRNDPEWGPQAEEFGCLSSCASANQRVAASGPAQPALLRTMAGHPGKWQRWRPPRIAPGWSPSAPTRPRGSGI